MSDTTIDTATYSRIERLLRNYKARIITDPIPVQLSEEISALSKSIPTNVILEHFNKDIIPSCILIEIKLTNSEQIDYTTLLEKLSEALSLPERDFTWYEEEQQNSFQKTLRLRNYYKMRLLHTALLNNAIEDKEMKLQILNIVTYYYKSESIPWSNSTISNLCSSCIDILKTTENEAIDLLISFEGTLKQLTKINAETSKISKRGYRRQNANSDFFRGITPLLGNSFSASLNHSDRFKRENIGKLLNLRYIVDRLKLSSIEQYWNLVLPLLLHFLDESDSMIKVVACKCLISIFGKIKDGSNNIITKTDIGKILFDSIVPCLLALPSLTPVNKSMLILPTAYETVIQLADVSLSKGKESYYAKLVTLLDDFIFSSLSKASDYPAIVIFLLDTIKDKMIPRLGNYYMVVSKKVCYSVLDILVDPYSIYSSEMVLKCLDLINLVLDKTSNVDKIKYDVLKCLLIVNKRFDKYQSDKDSFTTVKQASSAIILNRLNLSNEELQQIEANSV